MTVEQLTRAAERPVKEEWAPANAEPAGYVVGPAAGRDAPAEPGGTVPKAFERILVAVDGSEQAVWAVEQAARIAAATGAELRLVHVVPDPGSVAPELAYLEPALRAQRREVGEATLLAAESRVPPGVPVDTLLHEGAVPAHVVAAADDWDADLIVIGTHGRGLIGRLLLGGTADSVIRHARCPVMTVAHPPPTVAVRGDATAAGSGVRPEAAAPVGAAV